MQVAETFTFPIPADQLPADIRTQLVKLLPADAAARRAACPTGNCPALITAAANRNKGALAESAVLLADGADVAVEIDDSSSDAGAKAAGGKKGKGKKKSSKKARKGDEEEEAAPELEVRTCFASHSLCGCCCCCCFTWC
jgi:hypothetical protein